MARGKKHTEQELFSSSDAISIHRVFLPRRRGLIGEFDLKVMKPGAILGNTTHAPMRTRQLQGGRRSMPGMEIKGIWWQRMTIGLALDVVVQIGNTLFTFFDHCNFCVLAIWHSKETIQPLLLPIEAFVDSQL